MVNGYNKTQIRLHWAIFILIALQYLLHEPMAAAWDMRMKGLEPERNIMVLQHAIGGMLIFVLVVWRLLLRLRRGAPPLPEKEPPVLKGIAHLTHFVLYALMLALPITGAGAFFAGQEGAAVGHEILRALMLLFVLLHILGALFQHVILKTDVLNRMRNPVD